MTRAEGDLLAEIEVCATRVGVMWRDEGYRGGLLMRSVTTLPAVQGHARLASGGLAEEIERLRAEPAEGDIAIGGATLAAEAAALGLIDEYRARVYPVLVGGGIPFFAQRERRVDLELVETRTFSSRVVYLRYRVAP
jgi:dihydrofolate reductase